MSLQLHRQVFIITPTSINRCVDYVAVSEVITNYSAASIPLETMWTDIGKNEFCVIYYV